jgi:hypothetical protein
MARKRRGNFTWGQLFDAPRHRAQPRPGEKNARADFRQGGGVVVQHARPLAVATAPHCDCASVTVLAGVAS